MTILTSIVAFFASTIGRYVLIALVAGAVLIGIRQAGYNAAHRACVAAAKARELEIAKRDVKIGELQAAEDQRIQALAVRDREKDDEFQRKLEEEIAKRPLADRCNLTEPDRRRLR